MILEVKKKITLRNRITNQVSGNRIGGIIQTINFFKNKNKINRVGFNAKNNGSNHDSHRDDKNDDDGDDER